MKAYNTVEIFMQPECILEKISDNKSEMLSSEIGFLCGLIRERQPKKIVEVGVAAGGTTAVILNCIQLLQIESKVFSVDLSETYYRDHKKKTGYLVEELNAYGISMENHKFLLGKVLPERLEEIGKEIDFLILDTMHVMPGEVLDFLAVFPYLAKDAVVVLHDTAFHHIYNMQEGIATSVLFQTVVAEKYLNNQMEYPNIAGFKLNSDTKKYITDVFAALQLPWSYIPKEKELLSYKTIFNRFYGNAEQKLFEQALEASQKFADEKSQRFLGQYFEGIGTSFTKIYSKIRLYGAGKRGKAILKYLKNCGIEIDGFIVSDDQERLSAVEGIPVYVYSEMDTSARDMIIILAVNSKEVEKKLECSLYNWIKIPDLVWEAIEQIKSE